MTPPIGDNLASRAAAVLLGCFAVAALLVMLVLIRPDGDQSGAGSNPFGLPLPEETKAITQALEASPPDARPFMLRALNTSVTCVRVEPAFPPVPPGLQRAPDLERMFETYDRALGGREIRVDLKTDLVSRWLSLRRESHVPAVRMMVALRGGGVLVIDHRAPTLVRSYVGRVAALFAGVALILIAGLAVAVFQTACPVRRLAESARRFSLDQAAPDLPMRGPREVRELAAAFNEMQGRIRLLVSERTRLLAAIAHDLRTYLTRLRLRAEFIDDPEQSARAERDIEEMSQLLDDTLLFASHTGRKADSSARCDVLGETSELLRERQELGDPVALVSGVLAAQPMLIGCPPLSLHRMLNNLIDNAIRYGDRAGVMVSRAPDAVLIQVVDDGPGVPAEALATLAQPFLRLETSRGRETGGAGLGLTIVKTLAESCGGSLAFSNRPGGGLCATLKFPI